MAAGRAFKTRAMERLWEQLRFTPPATLTRLMDGAERFLEEVDPQWSYRENEVIERITRYSPDAVKQEGEISGQALLADLATFIERASARAPLERTARGGALTMREAAWRLGVSATTVGRYRERGLVCHHVWRAGVRTPPPGARREGTPSAVLRRSALTERCVFAEVLEAFVARHARLVERARITGRLSAEAQEVLAARALERLDAGEARSLQGLARQLAPEAGCSLRTVRRMLERHPQVRARIAAPAMARAAEHSAGIDVRVCAMAWQLGFSPQQLARAGAGSVAACTRAVQRGRDEALRHALACTEPLELPTFTRQDSAQTLLAPPAVCRGLGVGALIMPTPRLDPVGWGGAPRGAVPADARGRAERRAGWDVAAVVAHHYLLWRARQALPARRRPGPLVLDKIERDLRWAYRLRRTVVEAALPDALARVAQHMGVPWQKVPSDLQTRWAAAVAQVLGQALDFRTLSRVTIDEAHPLRAAALAVTRMLTRPDLEERIAATPACFDAEQIAPWMRYIESGDRWVPVLRQLPAPHAAVITRRFGLDGAPPATLAELARLVPGSVSTAQARLYAALECARCTTPAPWRDALPATDGVIQRLLNW